MTLIASPQSKEHSMTRRFLSRATAVAVAALILAGCGGGGAGGTSVTPGQHITPQTGMVSFTFSFGGNGAANAKRNPEYISRATTGIGIRERANGSGAFPGTMVAPLPVAMDVSGSSSACTIGSNGARTCTVAVPAPVGNDDFEITAWDQAPVSGSFATAKELSTSTILAQPIIGNANNALTFTLNGIVDSIFLSIAPNSLVAGTSATSTVSVIAKDADGNIIIAPGTYIDANGNPLTITLSDVTACVEPTICATPGTIALGTTAFTGPAVTSSTVTYTGPGILDSAQFTATPSSVIHGSNVGTTLNFTRTNGGFPIPQNPVITALTTPTTSSGSTSIAVGPDGNLWIAEESIGKIARLTTAGIFTEFAAGTTNPESIVAGADGALWYTGFSSSTILRMNTSGVVTNAYPTLTANAFPTGITLGPDNNIWFTEQSGAANKIGKITPYGFVSEYAITTPNAFPFGITSGSDGNLWFTETAPGVDKVGVMTTAGAMVAEHAMPAGSTPYGITAGPDGNLWIAENGIADVGKMTTAGALSQYATAGSSSSITVGPDGNLWFTENAGAIGRITTAGALAEYSNGVLSSPLGIVTGPDGNLWFAEGASSIGKLVP